MVAEIDELIQVEFLITDIRVKSLKLDPNHKLMQLGDKSVIFSVKDFTLDLHANYDYISDPRVFDDTGSFNL